MHRALVGRHGRSIRLGVSGELCKASLHQELIFFTVSFLLLLCPLRCYKEHRADQRAHSRRFAALHCLKLMLQRLLPTYLCAIVVQVQDTPGYGDDLNIMNNIRSMITYIEQQNRRYLRMELDKQRTVDMSELPDPRVDCCIFCLQPHRLRPVDLR